MALCTGLSVSKLPQHPSNSPCYIENTDNDSDDSESECSYESVDGLSTPKEVHFEYNNTNLNEIFKHKVTQCILFALFLLQPDVCTSKEIDSNESKRIGLTNEEKAELTDLLNRLSVEK